MRGAARALDRDTRAAQAAVRARAPARLRATVWEAVGDRPARVWLVGSMARGDWVKAGDVDVASALDARDGGPSSPASPRIWSSRAAGSPAAPT